MGKKKVSLSLGACHPVGREAWSSTFLQIQHGMSILIHDVMALLCVAYSNQEIKFSLCLHEIYSM
jgi:hypothetical protein